MDPKRGTQQPWICFFFFKHVHFITDECQLSQKQARETDSASWILIHLEDKRVPSFSTKNGIAAVNV